MSLVECLGMDPPAGGPAGYFERRARSDQWFIRQKVHYITIPMPVALGRVQRVPGLQEGLSLGKKCRRRQLMESPKETRRRKHPHILYSCSEPAILKHTMGIFEPLSRRSSKLCPISNMRDKDR